MRPPSAPSRSSRSFLAVLALASLAGAAYGLLEPTYRGLERVRLSITEVEPFGQDIDGDGIATAAEGAIDLDGDGSFGELEARFFRMESFIEWSTDGAEDDGPVEFMIPNSCCVSYIGQSRRFRACLLFPPTPGVTCLAKGASCKTL